MTDSVHYDVAGSPACPAVHLVGHAATGQIKHAWTQTYWPTCLQLLLKRTKIVDSRLRLP